MGRRRQASETAERSPRCRPYADLAAALSWLNGVPHEQIQVLCGHHSVTTTEKYVKSRWRGIVAPNRVATAGCDDVRRGPPQARGPTVSS